MGFEQALIEFTGGERPEQRIELSSMTVQLSPFIETGVRMGAIRALCAVEEGILRMSGASGELIFPIGKIPDP